MKNNEINAWINLWCIILGFSTGICLSLFCSILFFKGVTEGIIPAIIISAPFGILNYYSKYKLDVLKSKIK